MFPGEKMNKLLILTIIAISLVPLTSALGELQITDTIDEDLNLGANEVGQLFLARTTNITTDVTIAAYSYPFDITFTPNYIPFLSDNTLNVSITIPSSLAPGTYDGFIRYTGNNMDTVNSWIPFIVLPESDANVTSFDHLETVASGQSGIFGRYYLENLGNTEVEFEVKIEGNASNFLETQKEVLLVRGAAANNSVAYNIPRDYELGNYSGNLTVSNDQLEVSFPFTLEVRDAIPPEITWANFQGEEYMATLTHHLEVTAEDNVKIRNVTAEVFYEDEFVVNATTNETGLMNVSMGYIEFEETDEKDIWAVDFNKTQHIGMYNLRVEAYDLSHNLVSKEYSFKNIELDSIQNSDVLTVSDIRFDTFVTTELFEMTEPTTINISLSDIEYSGNLTFRILRPDENEVNIDENITLSFSEVGIYQIMIQGNTVAPYSFDLTLEVVPQHVSIPNIEVTGDIVSYYIPQDRYFNQGSATVNQTVYNTGVLESSHVMICQDIPMKFFREENEEVYFKTQAELDLLEDSYNDKVKVVRRSRGWWIFSFVISILFIGFLLIKNKWQKISERILMIRR